MESSSSVVSSSSEASSSASASASVASAASSPIALGTGTLFDSASVLIGLAAIAIQAPLAK